MQNVTVRCYVIMLNLSTGAASGPRPERPSSSQTTRPSRAELRTNAIPRIRAKTHHMLRARCAAFTPQQTRRVAFDGERGRT